jgi:hypothetical protein
MAFFHPSDREASNQDDDAKKVQNAGRVPDFLKADLEFMPILGELRDSFAGGCRIHHDG